MEFPFTAHAQSCQESLDFTSFSKENMYVNLNEFKLYYFLKSHYHNMITSDYNSAISSLIRSVSIRCSLPLKFCKGRCCVS